MSAVLEPSWRRRLGREIRRRRMAKGLTQGQLGTPMTKGYVSAVEHGRAVPSLPALRLMVGRLDLSLAEFFAALDAEEEGAAGIAGARGAPRPAPLDSLV